jgi:hypothetical protein
MSVDQQYESDIIDQNADRVTSPCDVENLMEPRRRSGSEASSFSAPTQVRAFIPPG